MEQRAQVVHLRTIGTEWVISTDFGARKQAWHRGCGRDEADRSPKPPTFALSDCQPSKSRRMRSVFFAGGIGPQRSSIILTQTPTCLVRAGSCRSAAEALTAVGIDRTQAFLRVERRDSAVGFLPRWAATVSTRRCPMSPPTETARRQR